MNDVLSRTIDHDQTAVSMQPKWHWFVVLGVALILCGFLAIALPAISEVAASTVLGAALAVAGIVKIIQALQAKQWSGFVWQELTGAAELVGGILIYFNPLKGALAVALLVALVLFIQGAGQSVLAFKMRPQAGWHWLLVSGLVAFLGSAAVAIKLPYVLAYPPGTIAGIALLVGGCAYLAIAFAVRGAHP